MKPQLLIALYFASPAFATSIYIPLSIQQVFKNSDIDTVAIKRSCSEDQLDCETDFEKNIAKLKPNYKVVKGIAVPIFNLTQREFPMSQLVLMDMLTKKVEGFPKHFDPKNPDVKLLKTFKFLEHYIRLNLNVNMRLDHMRKMLTVERKREFINALHNTSPLVEKILTSRTQPFSFDVLMSLYKVMREEYGNTEKVVMITNYLRHNFTVQNLMVEVKTSYAFDLYDPKAPTREEGFFARAFVNTTIYFDLMKGKVSSEFVNIIKQPVPPLSPQSRVQKALWKLKGLVGGS